MRGLVWGTVVRDIPDNFILELAGHHHQRGRLSPTPKGALAAARTLGRSPSWHAPLPTPPLISLFDGATVPSQVALAAASTSPMAGHADGRPRPWPWREQRVRRRRRGSARSFSSAIVCPCGPRRPRWDRM